MKHLFLFCIVASVTCATGEFLCCGQGTESLEQRVGRGESEGFLQAANEGRKDLIPALEKYAQYPADERETIRVRAKMALAKLGVKKYLGEILLEVTDPTNAPVAKAWGPSFSSKHIALWVQMDAFNKLAYIKDRSTVKTLVAFLDAKENPEDYVERGGKDIVRFERPSNAAMRILPQIVDNPPNIDVPDGPDAHDAKVKVWQQWWQQNKDRYP